MGLTLLPPIANSLFINTAAEAFFSPTQKNISATKENSNTVMGAGISGKAKFLSLPTYNSLENSKIFSNSGASINLSEDAPAGPGSGHSSLGTPASSIDLVAGRMSAVPDVANNANIFVNDSFAYDAARIYCSQTTDLDSAFNLVKGNSSKFESRSGVGIKADGVAVIGRRRIKLVTSQYGSKNSKGGKIRSGSGIELIANNNDSDIQPIVKGDNVILVLEKIIKRINKLTDIVMDQAQTQQTYAAALQAHTHIVGPGPTGFPLVAAPSVELVPSTLLATIDNINYIIQSTSQKMNLLFDDLNHLTSLGAKYINSDLNRTT